jgi:hypothetical protein
LAYSFDETNDYLSIADNAQLTFPAAVTGWTFGCWVKLDDNTGTGYQYFASWGSFNATPSFNFYFGEASATGADQNRLICRVNDSDTSSVNIKSSTTPGTSTSWQHVMLVTTEFITTMYVNGTSVGTSNPANELSAINLSSAFELGRRTDASSTRYLGGDMAEVFKADFAVSADQIAALQVASPAVVLGGQIYYNIGWHIPLLGDVNDRGGNLAVTNNGAVVAEHPPIIQPRPKRTVFVPQAAVAGGTFTPYYYTNLLASG